MSNSNMLQIHQRYMSCLSLSTEHSYSEGEMIDDGQSEDDWRGTNKRARKRSGSLSTVLSVMGKAIGLGKTTPSKWIGSVSTVPD